MSTKDAISGFIGLAHEASEESEDHLPSRNLVISRDILAVVYTIGFGAGAYFVKTLDIIPITLG